MNPKQLPDGWRMVKFGEMATHISKRVEPSETDLDIYVGLEHLDPDSLRIKRHGIPGDVAGQKLLVKKGQIIFGKRRAYQRKLGLADWDCICSAHAMVLEANPEIVLPEFLPFFMQSDVFMNRAVAISEGSLSPTIKWKILANQEFLIPEKKEQIKLTEILIKISQSIEMIKDCIDSAIKMKWAAETKFLIARKNTYKSGEWKEYIFNEIVDTYIDFRGRTPKKLGFDWGQGNIKALSANNIKDGYIDFDAECHLGSIDLYERWMTKSDCQKGDIILTMEAPFGNVAQIPDDDKYILSQRVILIRPKVNLLDKSYLFHLIRSYLFRQEMERFSTGTTAKGIKRSNLDRIKITIPKSSEIQRKISITLTSIDLEIMRLSEQRLSLSSLFHALLNKKNSAEV